MSAKPRIRWSIVCLGFTAAGLLRFTYLYLDDLTRDLSGTLVRRIIEEGTGAYAALLLFPLVLWLERRRPLDGSQWRRNWASHVGGVVAYSALHTTLLASSRWLIYSLLGMGTYDYGRMPLRYFMEAPEDLIAYSVFVGILTLMRVHETAREQERRAAELSRDAAQAQLAALGLRLQPHFLFNALNTISSTIYADPVAADTMVGHLGDLLRQALRTGDRQEISVAEELDTLRAYLAIVDARFGDRVECELQVHQDTLDLAVPAFLLQPLVENAVRHGSTVDGVSTTIGVRVTRAGSRLRLEVENDAAGAAAEPELGTGLGTTTARLRLLYGDDHQLEARAAAGRFRVAIAIPAHVAPTPPPLPDTNHARSHR